jgi:hypothetical protein
LRAREWRKPKEAQMAHFHNLSIFDVSRIDIWRNAEGGERPELRLEGLSLFPDTGVVR